MAQSATQKEGFTPEVIKNLVGRIEGYFSDLDSERGQYMQKCRSIREDIDGIYEEAKARGIPKKELRVLVRARQKLEAARRVLEDLEDDQRETVEMLAEAFGDAADLPLFKSKIEQAQGNTIDDVR